MKLVFLHCELDEAGNALQEVLRLEGLSKYGPGYCVLVHNYGDYKSLHAQGFVTYSISNYPTTGKTGEIEAYTEGRKTFSRFAETMSQLKHEIGGIPLFPLVANDLDIRLAEIYTITRILEKPAGRERLFILFSQSPRTMLAKTLLTQVKSGDSQLIDKSATNLHIKVFRALRRRRKYLGALGTTLVKLVLIPLLVARRLVVWERLWMRSDKYKFPDLGKAVRELSALPKHITQTSTIKVFKREVVQFADTARQCFHDADMSQDLILLSNMLKTFINFTPSLLRRHPRVSGMKWIEPIVWSTPPPADSVLMILSDNAEDAHFKNSTHAICEKLLARGVPIAAICLNDSMNSYCINHGISAFHAKNTIRKGQKFPDLLNFERDISRIAQMLPPEDVLLKRLLIEFIADPAWFDAYRFDLKLGIQVLSAIRDMRPRCVVTFYYLAGGHVAFRSAANKCGVPNYYIPIRGGVTAHARSIPWMLPDAIILSHGKQVSDAYEAMGYPPKLLNLVGNVEKDVLFNYDAAACRRELADILGRPPRKTVLLAATSGEVCGEKTWLRHLAKHAARDGCFDLIIKPHPALGRAHYADIIKDKEAELFVIEGSYDIYSLLNACDVLLTDWSYVGFEGCMLNKPLVVPNLSGQTFKFRFRNFGVALEALSLEELDQAIDQVLHDDAVRKSLESHRYKFVNEINWLNDGKAVDRAVDRLASSGLAAN